MSGGKGGSRAESSRFGCVCKLNPRATHTHTHPTSIRFAAYGESAAFFVSTGVNALYILYGGLILYPRMLLTDKVTPEMRRLPKVSLRAYQLCVGCCWGLHTLYPTTHNKFHGRRR